MASSVRGGAEHIEFAGNLCCPDLEDLPIICEPGAAVEAFAPGSIYQPLLLEPNIPGLGVGPGALDEHEAAFVRDLILWLRHPGEEITRDWAPLTWNDKRIWYKRNIDKDEGSFRLRVDDSNWYYPDFLLWILDPNARTQTIGFVDPKGLKIGVAEGWSDYKIVSTNYVPHVIEREVRHLQKGGADEHAWSVRVRGALVSTSPYEVLSKERKFFIRTNDGKQIPPSIADFRRAHIIFQDDSPSYIGDVLDVLSTDTELDEVSRRAIELQQDEHFVPLSSLEQRIDATIKASATACEFFASLVMDWCRYAAGPSS